MYFYRGSGSSDEDDMLIDEVPELVLNKTLEQQITNAVDSRFLLQLVCTYSLSYEITLFLLCDSLIFI